MQRPEVTPYQTLAPSEQVFRLDYWGGTIPDTELPDLPHLIPFKNALPRPILRDIGSMAIDVIDGRLPINWINEPGTRLTPVDDGHYFSRPGALVVFDTEKITPFSGGFVKNKVRKAAARQTSPRMLAEGSTERYLLDAVVTDSPLSVLRAENYRAARGVDRISSSRPIVRDTIAFNYIVDEELQRIYLRETGLGYIAPTRQGLALFYFFFATTSHAGVRITMPSPSSLELGTTITHRERGGGMSRSRLRAVGFCGVGQSVTSPQLSPS